MVDASTSAANEAATQTITDYNNNGLQSNDKPDSDDDAEYDCVPMTNIPSVYASETPLSLYAGICGYKY